MCLKINREDQVQIATEDIVCYKYLNSTIDILNLLQKIESGDEFEGVIQGGEVSGKIYICRKAETIYFCHDNELSDGLDSPNKQGYEYSWKFDESVDTTKTTINGELLYNYMVYVTPYYYADVEMGMTYESELKREYNDDNRRVEFARIEMGLHSFQQLQVGFDDTRIKAKCIIPKGSEYYVGTFDGCVSYASNKLKYVEIITE